MTSIVAFVTAAFATVIALTFPIEGSEPRDPNLPIIDHVRPWHCASRQPLQATAALDTTDTHAIVRIAVATTPKDTVFVVECVRR